jgi:hypothetical protein
MRSSKTSTTRSFSQIDPTFSAEFAFSSRYASSGTQKTLSTLDSTPDTRKPTKKEEERRLFNLNVLTGLAAIGQSPMRFTTLTNESETQLLQHQAASIIHFLLHEIQNYFPASYPNIRIIMNTVNVSLFPSFIPLLADCKSLECIVVTMRGIAWNMDFCAICEADDFRDTFIRMYDTVTSQLFEVGLTRPSFFLYLTVERLKKLTENVQIVKDFLVLTYRVLYVLKQRWDRKPRMPYPTCEVTLIENKRSRRAIERVFGFIFETCAYPVEDEISERLHFYAVHCLSLWFDACSFSFTENSRIRKKDFLERIDEWSQTVPNLLQSVLKHHIPSLLSLYIERAASKQNYFKALCEYFKVSSPKTLTLPETLTLQWRSVKCKKLQHNAVECARSLYE